MWDSHGVPICRVIRFYLARFIIDSNRWLLISYKQWLSSSAVFTSNIYGTNIEFWKWKEILWTVDVSEVIDDDTCSNTIYDNICSILLMIILLLVNLLVYY